MGNLTLQKQWEVHLIHFLQKIISLRTSMRKFHLTLSCAFPISSLHKILCLSPTLVSTDSLVIKYAFIICLSLINVIWCLSTSSSTTFLSLSVNSLEIILYTHPIRLIGLKSQLLGYIIFRNQRHICCISGFLKLFLGVVFHCLHILLFQNIQTWTKEICCIPGALLIAHILHLAP